MKVFFKVRVSNFWEDPPEIEVYEHSLEDDCDWYAKECLQEMLTRECWLDEIPLPARLPGHDFLIIGIATLTNRQDYWSGEYDTDIELDKIQYRSWPSDMDDKEDSKMTQLD